VSLVTLLADPERFGSSELRVDGEPYRHLFRARRLAVGDRVRVVDGEGRARWSAVSRIDRAAAVLVLGESAPDNEPPFRLVLLVPALRPERTSWLVEKATEVGVAAVHFFQSERAPRDFGAGAAARLRRVAAAAVEQCHRSRIPLVTGPHDWRELAGLSAGVEGRWVLDPASASGWGEAGGSGALLIGPEGGWSESERGELRETSWRSVGLGPRVLRAETAAVVGAAALLLDTCRASG
jgi:16S rRNA (uracil1498-N3)-methyltransferase